jgi:hypothetical protein
VKGTVLSAALVGGPAKNIGNGCKQNAIAILGGGGGGDLLRGNKGMEYP